MASFLASLARDDLSTATLRGYRYDLRHFLAWHRTVQDAGLTIGDLADFELIAYRQHMVAAGRRPATVNRRLDALRRLCRWARGTGALAIDVARDVRPMRTARGHQPAALTDAEVHAVLRVAGASSHGLAARNYALVQLMLQAGLRVGEVAALQASDITMSGPLRDLPADGQIFLDRLSAEFDRAARAAQRGLSGNRFAAIRHGQLTLKQRDAMLVSRTLRELRATIGASLGRVRIEDLLQDVDEWCGFTQAFQPLGGYQPRSGDPHRSLLATLTCLASFEICTELVVDQPKCPARLGSVQPCSSFVRLCVPEDQFVSSGHVPVSRARRLPR